MHRRDANNYSKRKREEDTKLEDDLESMRSQRCSLIQERCYLNMEIQKYYMLQSTLACHICS